MTECNSSQAMVTQSIEVSATSIFPQSVHLEAEDV